MVSITRIIKRIKGLLAKRPALRHSSGPALRPQPVRVASAVRGQVKNTPWRGPKPRENTRSILWTTGGRCRVLLYPELAEGQVAL